jgi:hypothetical protein
MADLAASSDPELRMSREEYRRWAEAQPKGRFERVSALMVPWWQRRPNAAIKLGERQWFGSLCARQS